MLKYRCNARKISHKCVFIADAFKRVKPSIGLNLIFLTSFFIIFGYLNLEIRKWGIIESGNQEMGDNKGGRMGVFGRGE